MADYVFDRTEEREALLRKLKSRRSFLYFGPSGVGKTLLLHQAGASLPGLLWCSQATSTQALFRQIARELVRVRDPLTSARLGRNAEAGLRSRSAVALKGIVCDALRAAPYFVILDQLTFTSQVFAHAVRELTGWASTPVCAVTRSAHMEDAGFVAPLFPDRSERLELRNFDARTAAAFADDCVSRTGLVAENLAEFLTRVAQLSEGNPGAILQMVRMASAGKYRSADHIKVSPLYIDFRLQANAQRTGRYG
jgi:hypothetical protein